MDIVTILRTIDRYRFEICQITYQINGLNNLHESNEDVEETLDYLTSQLRSKQTDLSLLNLLMLRQRRKQESPGIPVGRVA